MARFVIQSRVESVDGLKDFDLDGYRFESGASEGSKLVFRRDHREA